MHLLTKQFDNIQHQSTNEKLIQLTNKKLTKMYEDQKQTPSLIIPKNLPNFIKKQKYKQLIQCVYKYCLAFNNLIKKYQQLKLIMSNRMNENLLILQKQRQDLQSIQKQLSYHYAMILLDNLDSKINIDKSNKEKRQKINESIYKDQIFFQTLIYLISRVIKDLFSRQDYPTIQQEINRLFRTNRYNLIKKRHDNDKMLKQFPILKDNNNKNKTNIAYILNKLPQQMAAYKKLQKNKREMSAVQPNNDYTKIMGINQIKDQRQRSPLICTWLPSKKSMLNKYLKPMHKSMIKANQEKIINLKNHFTLN